MIPILCLLRKCLFYLFLLHLFLYKIVQNLFSFCANFKECFFESGEVQSKHTFSIILRIAVFLLQKRPIDLAHHILTNHKRCNPKLNRKQIKRVTANLIVVCG
jgi:hypothetical protein